MRYKTECDISVDKNIDDIHSLNKSLPVPPQCKKTSDLMMKYMDGNLSKSEAERLNKHISECEECKEDFLAYDMIVSEFSESELIVAPDDLVENVMKKIKAEPLPVKNTDSSIDNIICAVWGIFSILFGLGFLLFLNKERIISLMEENDSFATYLQIINPVSMLITEVVANLQVVFDDAVLLVSEMVISYRYVILGMFAVLVVAQYVLKMRSRNLDVVYADEKNKKDL